MPPRTFSDQLDDAVDQFESNWCDDSISSIESLLAVHGLKDDITSIVELVRVDIQRRYKANLPVDLSTYFRSLPVLDQFPKQSSEIAFEDYRTRRMRSLPVSPSRWEQVPGVADQSWYKLLLDRDAVSFSTRGAAGESGFASHSSFGSSAAFKSFETASTSYGHQQIAATNSFASDMAQAGFSIVRQIGEGAFSRVFLATQNELAGRHVVIKVVSRPLDEPRRLARLQHTNIVPIYSFHRTGQWSILCMPYAGLITLGDYLALESQPKLRSGQSFVSTLRQEACDTTWSSDAEKTSDLAPSLSENPSPIESLARPLHLLEALHRDELGLWIFARLSAALAHAHARGVLHGDIKPANVLIRNDGEPALLDFNLSNQLDGNDLGVIGGTLPYMAPELLYALMGSTCSPSATADIYSLGVVLYQFMTARLPYVAPRSAAPIDLDVAIEQRRLPVVWEPKDGVTQGMKAIVERCLALRPESRYQTADQLNEDIERELKFLPLKYAKDSSLRNRLAKWARRHPKLTSLGALGGIAAIMIAVLAITYWRVNESHRTLLAESIYHNFSLQSNESLAGLLAVGRGDQRKSAFDKADACLEIYGIFSRPDWLQQIPWVYLDKEKQDQAVRRMTDLLLRSTSLQFEERSREQTVHALGDLAPRLTILRQSPFVECAPVAIGLLNAGTNEEHQSPVTRVSVGLQAKEPIDVFAEALRFLELSNHQEALKRLTPSLLREVDPFSYWIALGRAEMDAGYLPSAQLSFSMAIESLQKSHVGYYYRGVCRLRMRSLQAAELAIADFTTAIHYDPRSVDAKVNRAMAKEVVGDLVGALEDLNKINRSEDKNTQSLILSSRIYRKLNQGDLSQRDYDEAIQIPPTTISGWLSRSLARLKNDKLGALQDLIEAQKIAPRSIEILQNKAHIYSEHLGENKLAIEALTQLLEVNPSFENALIGRAVLYAREGQVQKALDDIELARPSNHSPVLLYQTACAYALASAGDSQQPEKHQFFISESLRNLSNAIQNGYGADLIETDADLNPIRQERQFKSILATVRLGRRVDNRLK